MLRRKPASSERQRKHPAASSFTSSESAFSYATSNKNSSKYMSFPLSIILTSTLYGIYFPVNRLLALPLYLSMIYLILFTTFKQKVLGLKESARAEPQHS